MCGIFSILNETSAFSLDFINKQFEKGKGRGPENSKLEAFGAKTILGFHRLAINGLNDLSNQPICIGNITLICNGEIYNFHELYQLMNVVPETDSDCEVIIHLYNKYGMEHTLQMLDGVYAFILMDNDITQPCTKMYVARDPYGVRPLYKMTTPDSLIGFASEVKSLAEFQKKINKCEIEHFKPGTYSIFTFSFQVLSSWIPEKEYISYHSTGFNSFVFPQYSVQETIFENIRFYLTSAVKKRYLNTERPIACLLSGGLDSSLITALVNECRKTDEYATVPLETYSIGLEGSEDLKHAKIVADYLGTKHTEIVLTEKDFLDAIPEVIYAIESYDTTTVRASIGNYLLGKYIAEHSNAKVIFNGDGSDELCGGYLYMHSCPDHIEFDKESRRLLKDIHAFDVLRSDKCISSHGLEPRTPFLDRSWVQYYLSIDPQIRFHAKNSTAQYQCEKFLLRTSFSPSYFLNSESRPLLPDNILWRTKEAFSDGVSKTTRSLYEIIQDHVKNIYTNEMNFTGSLNAPVTLEQKYYRYIFDSYYEKAANIVPYFWMPKYVNATDASARTLKIYSEIISNQVVESELESDLA